MGELDEVHQNWRLSLLGSVCLPAKRETFLQFRLYHSGSAGKHSRRPALSKNCPTVRRPHFRTEPRTPRKKSTTGSSEDEKASHSLVCPSELYSTWSSSWREPLVKLNSPAR
jgi:hypothetical protein